MATIEQFGVLCQLSDQSFRLVRNYRQNAAQYKTIANAIDGGTVPPGTTVTTLINIMKNDAFAFHSRVDTITALVLRNQPMVQNALAIIGETLANMNSLKTTVLSVCDHTTAATLTTTQQCRDEADFILATLPAYEGAF